MAVFSKARDGNLCIFPVQDYEDSDSYFRTKTIDELMPMLNDLINKPLRFFKSKAIADYC
jgi:hypothetical protein